MPETVWFIFGVSFWFGMGLLGSHIGFSKVARAEPKTVWRIWKERGVIGPALGFAGPATIYAALTLNRE